MAKKKYSIKYIKGVNYGKTILESDNLFLICRNFNYKIEIDQRFGFNYIGQYAIVKDKKRLSAAIKHTRLSKFF